MKAFDSTPGADCYVIGCLDEAHVCRTHRRFGNVATCHAHDPERFGQARALAPGAGPRDTTRPTPTRTAPLVPVPPPLDPPSMTVEEQTPMLNDRSTYVPPPAPPTALQYVQAEYVPAPVQAPTPVDDRTVNRQKLLELF